MLKAHMGVLTGGSGALGALFSGAVHLEQSIWDIRKALVTYL